jgi:hypothetical protein
VTEKHESSTHSGQIQKRVGLLSSFEEIPEDLEGMNDEKIDV